MSNSTDVYKGTSLHVVPFRIIVLWLYSFGPSALGEKCLYSEFFWSVFSRIWTEHGEILLITRVHIPQLNSQVNFCGEQPTNCLSVFDHFVSWCLKG